MKELSIEEKAKRYEDGGTDVAKWGDKLKLYDGKFKNIDRRR